MAVSTSQRFPTTFQGVGLLVVVFCAWKAIFLTALVLAPGIGYDTSTSLLAHQHQAPRDVTNIGQVPDNLPLTLKLVRWDAIYFSQIARRGYVFEQESAFGPGFPSILAFVGRGIYYLTPFNPFPAGFKSFSDGDIAFTDNTVSDQIHVLAFLGAVLSNFCHLLSVLLLYTLTQTVFLRPLDGNLPSLAIATLHIISPAGVFLASPFSESLFSVLSFLGFHLYLKGLLDHHQKKPLHAEIQTLAAGVVFGVATTVRSNGLLNGGLFLYDAAILAQLLVRGNFSIKTLRRLTVTCVGGGLTGLGAIVPQYRLYTKYCYLDQVVERRPWCSAHIPSIYTWVQSHYWNVGFFRYWTISNIPLFLLAAPTIYLLCRSSVRVWSGKTVVPANSPLASRQSQAADFQMACLSRLAVPQALIAIMALFNYHVQIITRLSSGYPLWYLSLYLDIAGSQLRDYGKTSMSGPRSTVRWMVIYSMVQGVLFASFLPPA